MLIESPLEQFEVVKIGGQNIVKEIGLEISNISIWMFIGIGISIIIGQRGGQKIIGERWSKGIEGIYKIGVGMVRESIGKEGGGYVGQIYGLLTIILVWNIIGLIPYGVTVTAQIILTGGISLGVWIGKLIRGGRKHGRKMLGMLLPGGAPIEMGPFFVIVELIGFIIPLISLGVRLFANMMSGHILLKVLFGFTWKMSITGGILTIIQIIPLGILFMLIGLEIGVGLIQAYVFALLTCIYIGDGEKGSH